VNGSDIGIIGLGTMGRNLALNLAHHGYRVTVFNRTVEKALSFANELAAAVPIHAATNHEQLLAALDVPRKLLVIVRAGDATDAVVRAIAPRLEAGDVLMDGGNAHPRDTDRRCEEAERSGVHYLGVGISGGGAGALDGPSLMVGGDPRGYEIAGPILEAVAADGPEGTCCALLGPGSAGHYVKMVHNGIEYAIMQLLAESYDLMTRGLGLDARECAEHFSSWNEGPLEGFLLEITAQVLRQDDPHGKGPLVNSILDAAAQKGTGKWSSQSALDLGSPAPTIAAAVFARIASSLKPERVAAREQLSSPSPRVPDKSAEVLADLEPALHLAVLDAYAQGFRQLADASAAEDYGLELAEVARVWMDGCIIRSALLTPIAAALHADCAVPYLWMAEPFRSQWSELQGSLRRTVSRAVSAGIPSPCFAASLAAVDAYRSGTLPANLIQAQRDAFGAHTYQRNDRKGRFHTEWGKP
jgi:6-phosphogluconate dehydrogenase